MIILILQQRASKQPNLSLLKKSPQYIKHHFSYNFNQFVAKIKSLSPQLAIIVDYPILCSELYSKKRCSQIPTLLVSPYRKKYRVSLLHTPRYISWKIESIAQIYTEITPWLIEQNYLQQQVETQNQVIFTPFVFHLNSHSCLADQYNLNLTQTEFKILLFLCYNRGNYISREKMLQHIWGYQKNIVSRTCDTHIRRLRIKLAKYAYLLESARYLGYRIIK